MVPAELVPEAVAVFPYARSKPSDFFYERVTIEIGEIVVHVAHSTGVVFTQEPRRSVVETAPESSLEVLK